MHLGGVVLIAGDAAAAALLLVAGAAKAVAPAQLIRALSELGPRTARLATRRTVQAAAAIEALAAFLLVVSSTRLVGAGVVGLLGLTFAGLGVLGARSGGTTSCGCLGAAHGRPLGAANVLVGAALVLVATVNAVVPTDVLADWGEGAVALGAAICALLLSAWLYRRLISVLVLERVTSTNATEASA